MESYIKKEIQTKMQEIDKMHGVLGHFTELGKKVEVARVDATARTEQAKASADVSVSALLQATPTQAV
jgi:predicted nucleic acid-binding Zn ribbon protein